MKLRNHCCWDCRLKKAQLQGVLAGGWKAVLGTVEEAAGRVDTILAEEASICKLDKSGALFTRRKVEGAGEALQWAGEVGPGEELEGG